MPRVIVTHGVGNMDTWLSGGAERAEIFRQFSSGYRVYRHEKENRVAIVWENVDMQKLGPVLGSRETESAKARHTVRDPIEIFETLATSPCSMSSIRSI